MMKRALFLIFLLFLQASAAISATSAELDERKNERRLLFNRYYEEQLAASARTSSGEEKPWALTVGSSYGYDSNAILESPPVSDRFFRQEIDYAWTRDFYGIDASAEYLTYHEETESDFSAHTIAPFVEFEICPAVRLREQYDFSYLHYPQDEDLRYFGHRLTTTLTHRAGDKFEHSIHHAVEFKDYTDRNALSSVNTGLAKNRDDIYNEVGYSLRLDIFKGTTVGATGVYKRNHSNDVYRDYNDYGAWAASAFVYRELASRVWVVGSTGYDYKRYQARTFFDFLRDRNDKPERDNFVYAGASLYYALRDNLTLNVSYLYNRNRSNDIDLVYFGNTVSAGLTWTL